MASDISSKLYCTANPLSYSTTTGNYTYASGNSSLAIGVGNSSNYNTNLGYATLSTSWDNADTYATSLWDNGRIIIECLTEEELIDLIEKLRERLESENYKQIIKMIVRTRHCSEAFIMEYASDLTKDDYYQMHKSDILSKNYPQLALMLESLKI